MAGLLGNLYETLAIIPNSLGFAIKNCEITTQFIHETDQLPLVNQKIKVYAQILFFRISIGEFQTDIKGRIHTQYHWLKLPFQSNFRLIYEIFEDNHKILRNSRERLISTKETSFEIEKEKLLQADAIIKVSHHEYKKKPYPILFTALQDSKAHTAEVPTVESYLNISQAQFSQSSWKERGIKVLESFLGPLSNRAFTELLGFQLPAFSLDEKSMLDLVLNGMFPQVIQDFKEGGYWQVSVCWDDYQFEKEALPNATLTLKKSAEGVSISNIKIKHPDQENKTYYPGTVNFREGLKEFYRTAFIQGLLSYQLATHHEIMQYAIALFRHLNNHVIKKLLAPFLIGHFNNHKTIESQTTLLLKQAGLTSESIAKAVTNVVAGSSYQDNLESFIPQSLDPTHHLASDSKIVWEQINKGVKKFFDIHKEQMEYHWPEINLMNRSLQSQSLNYQPWPGRPYNAARDQACPSILVGRGEQLESGDLAKLEHFCVYVIYQAIWMRNVQHAALKVALNSDVLNIAPAGAANENRENLKTQIAFISKLLSHENGLSEDVDPSVLEILKASTFVAQLQHPTKHIFQA